LPGWSIRRLSRCYGGYVRGSSGPAGGVGQLLLFCLGSFLLFAPNLGRTFASDDFEVIWRVGKGDFRTPGFFRPLSDWTLYLTYLLGGFRPAGYYAFNILVHGVDSYLVFVLLERLRGLRDRERGQVAWLASLFFLVYPFHSEGIDWILGRGASLAALFGLGALVLAAVGRRGYLWWAAGCYFMAMLVYETAVVLPALCVVILWMRGAKRGEVVRWVGVLGAVLLIQLVVRTVIAGGVWGQYEQTFLGMDPGRYAGNVVRVGMRLLIPPMENGGGWWGAFAVLAMGVVVAVLWRRGERRVVAGFFLMTVFAAVPAVLVSVSTRTTESDRMLYFPSVFVCCLLGYGLVRGVRSRIWRWLLVVAGFACMIFFLEKANRNWVAAAGITREIVRVVTEPVRGKVYLINLPDERDGAYIFRLGFPEALLMAGKDTAGVVVVNHFSRQEWLMAPDSIGVDRISPDEVRIGRVVVRRAGRDSLVIDGRWAAGRADRVLYWNKKQVATLGLP
jgi:protein O-mannosyl-transferase